MKFLERFRAWNSARHSPPPIIKCDAAGITKLWKTGDSEQLTWDQIDAVFAYKKDCLTTDQIRLIFKNDSSGVELEVTEDELGYKDLTRNLSKYLQGCQAKEHWFERVATPVFETNWTQIFSRDGRGSQPDIQ